MMKLHKYNQFLGLKTINEDLNKSKKFLKERYLLRKAAEEMGLVKGELEQQLKHGEKKSLTLSDFTEEQAKELSYKMRGMKISGDEVNRIEKDPEFLKLRELLKDNIGYLYNFTYMYYVEMVPLEEIESMYSKLLEYKDLLNKLPKKFDANFIDTNITNNNEILIDGLDSLEDHRKVKKVLDKLPSNLKQDYNKSSDGIKESFAEIARAFNDLGKKDDGSIDEVKRETLWKSFFGEMKEVDGKKRYVGQLKRYNTITEFIRAAQNYLKSSQNSDVLAFYQKINDCNSKFGQAGADIEFDENGILIIEVKSFPANQMLNGHTRHCIKDSNSQWENYVASHNNKQYYIYNFNIPQYDSSSVIGITIEPGQKIRAAHDKNDSGVSSSIKSTLKKWQKEYGIDEDLWSKLKPMSDEEIEKRERAKKAERKIVEKGLSIDDIIRYVKDDGANINKDNGICLLNAVMEDDLEKVKTILELGASPNLRSGSEAPISKAKNLEMIKLLVSNGSDMTGDVFENVADNVEALKYCLNAGLDPNFNVSLPMRRVCKGSWVSKDEIGESYYNSFLTLLDNGATLADNRGNTVLKFAGEYGRYDIINFLLDGDLYKEFTDAHWVDAIKWAQFSRRLKDKEIEKVVKYLKDRMPESIKNKIK